MVGKNSIKRMRKNSRPTIGFLLMRLRDSYENTLMLHLTEAAKALNVNLIAFAGAEYDLGLLENDVFQLALSEFVDGLVVCPTLEHSFGPITMHKFLQRYASIPIVAGALSIPDIPRVMADDYAGMYAVVEHLVVQHKCKRIAFIRGLLGQHESEERYRAYCEVLAKHDIAVDEALVLQGDFSEQSAVDAVREFLSQNVAFEAIVSANDSMAIGALSVLEAAGLHVPDDVLLAGFDDIDEARNLNVPLTTACQQFAKSAYTMLDLLLRKIRGEVVSDDMVTIPAELVVRRSCGCLPAVIQHARLTPEAYASEVAEIGPQFIPDDVPEDMWRKFLMDVSVHGSTDFLLWFERKLQQAYATQDELVIWEETLSALRHHALPYFSVKQADLPEGQALFRAENLLQQARVLVGDVALRRMRAALLDERARVAHLQSLGRSMTGILDLQDLKDALGDYLPDAGIPHCHVLIFPEDGADSSEVQLLFSYLGGKANFFESGPRFVPAQLLAELFNSGQVGFSVVVMPLLAHLRLLGYVVLDFGQEMGWIYDQIGSEVSSAVFRAQLMVQQQQAQHDVEQLLTDAQRRAALLAGAAEVSQATTSLTNLSVLLPRAVELIRERLGLYYAGIFLVDDARQWAVLRAGTGEAGRIMLERGHKLEIAPTSMIGRCVTSGEAQITFDAEHEASRRQNPVLPETRSEMALPLISSDRVIGAMTIQSSEPGAFSQEDITTLQAMAGQLANAIENARLIAQMAQSRRELEIASGQYTAKSWREFVERAPKNLGYRYRHVDIEPAPTPNIEAQAALEQAAPVFTNLVPGEEVALAKSALGVPIRLRNQTLGVLDVRFEDVEVPEETIELVEQIADRLAISLESARLLQETRSIAEREQLLGHVTGQMRASLDVDAVLRTAATQIREVMDLSSVIIRLATRTMGDV